MAKQTKIIMGMPVTVEIAEARAKEKDIEEVFSYFTYVDEKFSIYKESSEISAINRGMLHEEQYSKDMKTIFALAEETKKLTGGYFDILTPNGAYDPSGIVKGWAIHNASELLKEKGFINFFVDAGGDIEAHGKNSEKKTWSVGIRNPFDREKIIKTVYIEDKGIATSGTYIRGAHIYVPQEREKTITDIVSLTVIGPNAYEADRFATAAFAMGKDGIFFIEKLNGFEGYMINKDGIATMTSGFETYTHDYIH